MIRNAGLRTFLSFVLVLAASICSPAYAQVLLADPDQNPDPRLSSAHGFGVSVAIAGRTAFVGAPYSTDNDPVVHVFEKQKDGTWTPTQRIAAPNAGARQYARFGMGIVFDGFTALIWAAEQNVVYEYIHQHGRWRLSHVLTAPAGSRGFGSAGMKLQGCQAFIHNVGAVGSRQQSGAILVYNRCRHWVIEQTLLADDIEPGSHFGASLDVSWDELMVGATGPGHSVYHYVRRAGRWVRKQRILTPDATATGAFGVSVAFDRNFLVVGDPDFGYQNEGSYQWGAAYVFRRVRGQWIEEDRLQPDPSSTWAAFGWITTLSHGSLLITAPDPAGPGNKNPGALFVYREGRHGFEFSYEAGLGSGTGYGEALATFGREVIVGAPFAILREVYLNEGAAEIRELPRRHDWSPSADRDSDDDSEN